MGELHRDGLLLEQTPRDRGLIERPIFCPHLDVRMLPGDAVFLVSESASYALYGKLFAQLACAIDGQTDRRAIAAQLRDSASTLQVNTALARLAAKGYIVSAEFAMPLGQAALWTSLSVSPLAAEEKLRRVKVSLSGADAAELAAGLAEFGIDIVEDGDLHVAVVGDYLDRDLAVLNAGRLAAGKPWLAVRLDGMVSMVGPVFRPGESACWQCLAHRVRGNREVSNYLGYSRGDGAETLKPRVLLPAMRRAAVGLAALEIAKWIVIGRLAPIHDRIATLHVHTGLGEHHNVTRRPQCTACGDPALYAPDRAPVPIQLVSRTKTLFTSGGMRSVPPSETVARYRHQVSPLSGVVTQLMRTSDNADPWLHVFWAGSNLALKNDSLRLLRTSLRTKSSGKGSSPDQAEASALCEAIERYSGVYHGDEIRVSKRLIDFGPGEAIHPNEVMGFSQRQYAMAGEINARGGRFNYVPLPFDPEQEMDWSPIWSLTHGTWRWLPTAFLYFSYPAGGKPVSCGPDSNGAAAGNTLEEAIIQGFLELVERDAFAIWWYNRLRRPAVDLASFGDPYLSAAAEQYRKRNRDIWVLDVTSDLGVPVFVAVSRRTDKPAEDIIFSAGAHFDPHIAILRAVCELNQYLGAIADVDAAGNGYFYDDPESLWWWQNVRIADEPYLLPDPAAPVRRAGDWPKPATTDLLQDIANCRRLVEERGMEMLVLDQTRPDIGMPVAKVVVPGMRHFWSRLAPGRLYDVPVQQGWLAQATPEADLNPHAVFI